MATIFGISKKWNEIKKKLEAIGLSASSPLEIESLLEQSQVNYEQQIKQVRQKLKNEVSLIRQEVFEEQEKVKNNLSTIPKRTSNEIEKSVANINRIKHKQSFLNFIPNFFMMRREEKRLGSLRKSLKEQQDRIRQSLHLKEMELERKKAQVDELSRFECREVLAQIEVLRRMLGSPVLADAIAEIELQEHLAQLPENCMVINNVRLNIDQRMLIEGKWLDRAQIDQLVITPSGLFAIDVSNWNKQSAEREFALDPYDQIKSAAQFCYEMIKSEFPGITVRSILAYRGRAPEINNPGIVKSLPLQEVPNYINWFKDKSLDDQTIQRLNTHLAEMNTTVTA
jgi:hypothetical protein